MTEPRHLLPRGASITAPTDNRGFKPYVHRGSEPRTPPAKPENPHTCETTGKRVTTDTYRQHLKQGEPASTPCPVVSRLVQRRREQHRTVGVYCKAPKPCSAAGYAWHIEQGETPCPQCIKWNQKENQK